MNNHWPPSVAPYQETHDRYLFAAEMARIRGDNETYKLMFERSNELAQHIGQWWRFVWRTNELAETYSALMTAGWPK